MMREFLSGQAWLETATPILIDAALKGAILFVIAGVGAYLLRNRSAASRHAVWTAAVVGHLAIPVFAVLLPEWRIPLLPQAAWMRVAPAPETAGPVTGTGSPQVDRSTPVAAAPEGGAPSSGVSVSADGSARTPPIADAPQGTSAAGGTSLQNVAASPLAVLAAIWFTGALLVLLRLAIGTWRVGQLARDGARVEDGMWLSLTQRLANRLGVSRPLTLLRGDSIAVPITWGIVYPAVLLPQDADTWPEERRRFVLVHEMAHVKRFDALTQLLAQLSVALFWFSPLVWLAAHRMRVEREHACDDYVLRDGTAPSLYAGELLEMVRSIGTPRHERAAPAFAALAMARRSEFEGRMLAILDPRLDRKTLNRRGTIMTGVIVALLTLPLAALRPFDQTPPTVATPPVSASTAKAPSAAISSTVVPVGTVSSAWNCDRYRNNSSRSTSTHISHSDEARDARLEFVQSAPGRCVEAAVIGTAQFSSDESRVAYLQPGGFARFRELGGGRDRSVSIVPAADGSLSYTAVVDGRTVPFDAEMQGWLSRFLPKVLREAGINVPARVARLRAQGGVPAVLREIGEIRSTGAKRSHYEELLKAAPLGVGDASKVVAQVGQDLAASSGDLSSVLQKLPRAALQNATSRQALRGALASIQSSGDKAITLEIIAPNADRETLIMLAKAAEGIASSGDKSSFLITTAAEYLTPKDDALHNAFFRTAATVVSDGDLQRVLVAAMSYGHANADVVMHVIRTTDEIRSDGDVSIVLQGLATQRLLTPRSHSATQALIDRTLRMHASGDRSRVLMAVARQDLLSTPAIREAYTRAAMAIPSTGDRANVLAAAAGH